MARRATARNLFMGEKMRQGMSMIEASNLWKEGHRGHERHNPDVVGDIFGRHQKLLLYGGGGLLILGAVAPTVASQIPIVGPLAVSLAAPLQGILGGLMPAPAAPALPPGQQPQQPSSNLNTASRPMGI